MCSFHQLNVMRYFKYTKAQGGREIRLRKLSDTRWCYQLEAIKAILSTYQAVVETLEIIVDSDDKLRA